MRYFAPLLAGAVLLLGVCMPAAGQAENPVGAFREFFSAVEAMRGSFRQQTLDEAGEVLESARGTMAIQRPDRFRWVYESPYRQTIVADGEDLWVYDVALEQVSVRPMDEMLAAGPALLLSGSYEALQRDFRITSGSEPGWVVLEARGSGWQFDDVRIRMDDGMPVRLELSDTLGQTTVLELGELVVNPGLDASLFRFEPPEGVDVIGREAMLGQ